MSKIALACLAFVFSVATFADSEELINDGFVDGAVATFQAGFVPGEIAAARFVPNVPCPCVVTDVSLIFGGSSETREMGVQIWEDPGFGNDPGFLVFSGTTTLAGSNNNFQIINLSQSLVIVNGPFRVGLEFNHAGAPTVATDLDGNIDSLANFILADIGALFWFQSSTLGVAGDFIIRATIDNFVTTDSDGDGIEDSSDNCTLVANAEQTDTDADGYGNACDGDFNNDCAVNFIDISSFSGQFLGTDELFDLNNDNVVNFLDLSLLTELFLLAPGPVLPDAICEPI